MMKQPPPHVDNNMSNLLQHMQQQIEYYFCPANLSRDIFLQQVLASNGGWVPISVISRFPKLQQLYIYSAIQDPVEALICRSVQNSHFVNVSADGYYLRPLNSMMASPPAGNNKNNYHHHHHQQQQQQPNIVSPGDAGDFRYSPPKDGARTESTISPTSFATSESSIHTEWSQSNEGYNGASAYVAPVYYQEQIPPPMMMTQNPPQQQLPREVYSANKASQQQHPRQAPVPRAVYRSAPSTTHSQTQQHQYPLAYAPAPAYQPQPQQQQEAYQPYVPIQTGIVAADLPILPLQPSQVYGHPMQQPAAQPDYYQYGTTQYFQHQEPPILDQPPYHPTEYIQPSSYPDNTSTISSVGGGYYQEDDVAEKAKQPTVNTRNRNYAGRNGGDENEKRQNKQYHRNTNGHQDKKNHAHKKKKWGHPKGKKGEQGDPKTLKEAQFPVLLKDGEKQKSSPKSFPSASNGKQPNKMKPKYHKKKYAEALLEKPKVKTPEPGHADASSRAEAAADVDQLQSAMTGLSMGAL